ncbi:MAG TPA: helix-turn-helix transcriptional regulator [Gemmatimonadaceae bacterium]|jgi:DNA-binding Xre family transcriptional regulator
MRLRVAEILDERGITAYELARRSGGRISLSAAYRFGRNEWKCLSEAVLEALCDVLDVDPGELLEREKRKRR